MPQSLAELRKKLAHARSTVEERPFRAAEPFRISDGFKPLWRRFVAQAPFFAAC